MNIFNLLTVKELTFNFYLKLTFLFIFLIFTVYLLFLEFTQYEIRNKEKFEQTAETNTNPAFGLLPEQDIKKGGRVNKTVQDILFKYVPGIIAYYTFLQSRQERRKDISNSDQLSPLGTGISRKGQENLIPGFASQQQQECVYTSNLTSEEIVKLLKDKKVYLLANNKIMLEDIKDDINNSELLERTEKILCQAKIQTMAEKIATIFKEQAMKEK
jgi:hypothetical protein